MNNILIGPFLGEFGYELSMWQGAVRHFLQDKLYDRVVVGCRKGHEYLYELATDFEYPKAVSGNTQAMCVDGHVPRFSNEVIQKYKPCVIYNVNDLDTEKQKYKKLGNKHADCGFDVLFHARDSFKYSTSKRNWPLDRWADLRHRLDGKLRIGSIGTKTEAAHIVGTEDLRDYPLSLLVDIIACSKMVIGPSSGAMHLTSFCGTPHIVWCNKAIIPGGYTTRYRYEAAWNPFNAKAIVVDEHGWHPPVDIIYSEIIKELNNG